MKIIVSRFSDAYPGRRYDFKIRPFFDNVKEILGGRWPNFYFKYVKDRTHTGLSETLTNIIFPWKLDYITLKIKNKIFKKFTFFVDNFSIMWRIFLGDCGLILYISLYIYRTQWVLSEKHTNIIFPWKLDYKTLNIKKKKKKY